MDSIGKLPYSTMIELGDRVYLRGGGDRRWTVMVLSYDRTRALVRRNTHELSVPLSDIETEEERSGKMVEELKQMKRELDGLGS